MKKLSVFLSSMLVAGIVCAVDYATLDVGDMKASSLTVYNTSGTTTLKGNVTVSSGNTLTLTGVTVTGGTIGSGAFNGTVGATTPSTSAFTTLAASSTLQVTGVATFTAESVHNGGIDTDYVTVDAGAGVDCKTAGALQLGVATATSVDVGVAGTMTTVKGTLNVDQAVTLDTTLGVTGQATVLTKGVVVDETAYVQMIQTTNVTMHSGTVWTQTWSTVFGAAPTTVIVTPTELHSAVPFVSSITPSNLLVTVEADKNFILTCIGKK